MIGNDRALALWAAQRYEEAIDGYRRTVMFGLPPRMDLVAIAAVSSMVILVAGYLAFKRMETGFADVA